MKEFKGTPGPWSYRKTGQHWNNSSLTNIEINFGTEGECIADTVYEERDAQLIAAAPELLSLLIELVDIEGPQPGDVQWAKKVNAAIDKALGESH